MVTKLNGGQKLQCGGDLISVTISWLLTVRVCNRFHIALKMSKWCSARVWVAGARMMMMGRFPDLWGGWWEDGIIV